jgi:radical SAM superfamily enzyme YgiQ (UPF0313 family)
MNGKSWFLKKLCKSLKKERIKILWGGYIRASKSFDKETASLMYETGCRWVFMGVESGSDKVLKEMNKQLNTDTIEKSIRVLHNSGIWVETSFIIGYPTETESDFLDTINFIVKNHHNIDSFIWYAFENQPGTVTYNLKNKIKFFKEEEIKERMKYLKYIFKDSFRGFFLPELYEKSEPKLKSKKAINASKKINKIMYEYVNRKFKK